MCIIHGKLRKVFIKTNLQEHEKTMVKNNPYKTHIIIILMSIFVILMLIMSQTTKTTTNTPESPQTPLKTHFIGNTDNGICEQLGLYTLNQTHCSLTKIK